MGLLKTKINKKSDEFRCLECGKLLALGKQRELVLEIKCVRCGTLNSIFRGVLDQVIVTDPEGFILYANSLVETITGYSFIEVIGKKPSLWGDQMPESFYEKMWQTIKIKKKPIMVIVNNQKKNGTLYKAKLQITPVFGVNGEIKMFVGVERVIK